MLPSTSPVSSREPSSSTSPTLQWTEVSRYSLSRLSSLSLSPDRATCSSTERTGDQRWWQVQIEADKIERIQVVTSPPSLTTQLSVFLIELLPGDKAQYKPCPLQFNNSKTYQEFSCQLEQGEYVYIRDDRLSEEHLTLCEVTVIPVRGLAQVFHFSP